jgi:rubredoxin
MDAEFWMKVEQIRRARAVAASDRKAMKALVREVEDRKEFPCGSLPKKPPAHTECPQCLSWNVDFREITTRLSIGGTESIYSNARYDCRRCGLSWNLNSGRNENAV